MRSFLHNKEVNVVVMGNDFGREMEGAFQDDLLDSNEINPEQWRHRPFSKRIKEWFARLLSYWL